MLISEEKSTKKMSYLGIILKLRILKVATVLWDEDSFLHTAFVPMHAFFHLELF